MRIKALFILEINGNGETNKYIINYSCEEDKLEPG